MKPRLIQVETITTSTGEKLDVIRDIEAVQRLELEIFKAGMSMAAAIAGTGGCNSNGCAPREEYHSDLCPCGIENRILAACVNLKELP